MRLKSRLPTPLFVPIALDQLQPFINLNSFVVRFDWLFRDRWCRYDLGNPIWNLPIFLSVHRFGEFTDFGHEFLPRGLSSFPLKQSPLGVIQRALFRRLEARPKRHSTSSKCTGEKVFDEIRCCP